jgi:mannose-6-phosphate isomerase-like protein (cupin superfamily)
MFENSVNPINLFDTLIQLRQGGVAEPSMRSRDADPGRAGAGLWTLTAFHADSDQALHSDVWECHPTGQEVLCVPSGAIHIYLRDHGAGAKPVATLTAGQCFIVPVGQWHRLSVSEPGDLLAITPRVDTQHERVGVHASGGRGEA